ncbi:pseudouridine synthase [Gemelliphila asaccharolytica]|uniref:Pseudouridine synthase n=1 Tax=Gemelliphila asaccharolytica TaxID=502393 RepID=A0ABR5TML4_9BACL|nr:pseudouridine synthase [Gemella asaccharolytica]KXB58566.1 pseudouridine synthase B, ribosomal large subunit [Gemella asaccharolytica]
MKERLQKIIASSGYTSRRKAEELILDGKVSLNGNIVKELGTKATADDIIIVNGTRILRENKKYYLFYKPEKVITSMSDEKGRKCVNDFFNNVEERVYPVGRLDYNTSGLLIMTNDGKFTNLITHPKNIINKVYIAKIKGYVHDEDIKKLRKGVKVENYITSKAGVRIIKNKNKSSNTLVEITIHEGKNRQVRKMFESLNYTVLKLKRISIEFLNLNGLKIGEYRPLTVHEVKSLINLAKNN